MFYTKKCSFIGDVKHLHKEPKQQQTLADDILITECNYGCFLNRRWSYSSWSRNKNPRFQKSALQLIFFVMISIVMLFNIQLNDILVNNFTRQNFDSCWISRDNASFLILGIISWNPTAIKILSCKIVH